VDATAVGTESVKVLRSKLDAPAGHQEGARHPGRGQAQNALAGFEGVFQQKRVGPGRNGCLLRLSSRSSRSFLGHVAVSRAEDQRRPRARNQTAGAPMHGASPSARLPSLRGVLIAPRWRASKEKVAAALKLA